MSMQADPMASEMYTLPDGQAVSIGNEGLELGELLLDGRSVWPELVPTAAVIHSSYASIPEASTRKVLPLLPWDVHAKLSELNSDLKSLPCNLAINPGGVMRQG